MSAPKCACGHLQYEHKRGRGGCRVCPAFGCDEYTSDALAEDLAELEASDPAVAEASQRLDATVTAIVERSRDAESTSAALARVERERDDAFRGRTEAVDRAVELAEQLAAVTRQRDRQDAACQQANEMWVISRDAHALTLAELASAQQELDALRTDLTEARAATVRVAEARAADAAVPLFVEERWACLVCGSRYGFQYDDHEHGPLTLIRVTITRP